MKINILTKGLRSYNGIAFLTPLILNKKRLQEIGIKIEFFTRLSPKLTDCDILILENKSFVKYWQSVNKFCDILQSLKKQNKLYLFDLGDSTSSWVLDSLPFIDRLYKSYLLKDKSLYTKKLYGGRIWTDYYHKQLNINDINPKNVIQARANNNLDKIYLGYGAAFGNYTLDSIFWQGNLKAKIAKQLWFLRKLSIKKVEYNDFVSQVKTNNISARMSVNNYSTTVAFQRKQTANILEKFNAPVDFLSRGEYLDELANSKIVVSPFGWGEVNYKDYETAMVGSILLKPDFSHLQTWPPIFNDKTVVQYAWDFSDLEVKINNIIDNYDEFAHYGIELQNQYKYFVASKDGQEDFCQYFKKILTI